MGVVEGRDPYVCGACVVCSGLEVGWSVDASCDVLVDGWSASHHQRKGHMWWLSWYPHVYYVIGSR